MRRGDVVRVAASGDYGKPRPGIVVQTDILPDTHASVIVCQLTSNMDVADYRVPLEPTSENGLRKPSQIMVDKPVTLRRDRVGVTVGRLAASDLDRLDATLAFVMGLGDGD